MIATARDDRSLGRAPGGLNDLASRVQRSSRLAAVPGVRHGITGRVIGMGTGDGNIGYGPPRDRNEAWVNRQAWSATIGVDAGSLVTISQLHGAAVARVGRADAGRGAAPGQGPAGPADAMITDETGVALLTLHADCLPLLLVDPDRPAIAAVHAGWRGTVSDIAGAAVRAMGDAFGSNPGRLLAYAGPAIGSCCYEVGPEVVQAWQLATPHGSRAMLTRAGRPMFDLSLANRELLGRAGVNDESIETTAICTRCSGDRWFSHRGQGIATGRFGAVIALVDDEDVTQEARPHGTC